MDYLLFFNTLKNLTMTKDRRLLKFRLYHSITMFSLCPENGRPNIVMIIADDMGYNDIGYHNPEVKTPHIGTFLHLLFYEC